MLNKIDLAKQFDLLTRQEIKNYQDSLNFVLQSIRELKDEIRQVNLKSLENCSLINNKSNSLTNQLNNIQQTQNEIKNKLEIHIRDTETFKKKATDEIGMHGDLSMKNSRKNEFNENTIVEVNRCVEILEDEIKGHSLTISNFFDNIQFKLSKDLKKMKEEIISIIPCASEIVRKDFEEKIACHKVDVCGIMKELNVFKKENIVIEKKLENIYTLIGRL